MKLTFGKSRFEVRLLGVFLIFILIFTFLRSGIAQGAAWMLAMTGEITVNADGEEPLDPVAAEAKKRKLAQRKKKAQKKKASVSNPGKAQRRRGKKTKTPIVLFAEDPPSWEDKYRAVFPQLRRHFGKNWNNEKTEIMMTTDGNQLFVLARFYDKFPENAITRYSHKQSSSAWQDDSMELFLMKDKKSKIYVQYVLSVSGIGHVFYIKTTKVQSRGASAEKPKNFAAPLFDVEKFDKGFDLSMTIDLSNIGINDIGPGDSFLVQFVRNYRGQGTKKAVTLQLFPTHIYADKRFGIINHDRRAFLPVKIIDSAVYKTMDKSNKTILKGLK